MVSRHKDEYQNHIASRLNDPKTNGKAYWSILKAFYNGRKVPVIPPLLMNNEPGIYPSTLSNVCFVEEDSVL